MRNEGLFNLAAAQGKLQGKVQRGRKIMELINTNVTITDFSRLIETARDA